MLQLVLGSYTDGHLDATKVNAFADRLSRSELKQYIKALKSWEKKTNVLIETALPEDSFETESFKKVFPDKKISVKTNPELLVGIRITNDDDVYDINLKNTLEKLAQYIEQDYD